MRKIIKKIKMKKENINTVDLKKMFIDSGKEVYHKLDSHWNNQGAAMDCNGCKQCTCCGRCKFSYKTT